MRTIGFRSNLLVAIAAACGVIAALGQPWYGPSPEPTGAQMEDLFNGIGRAFTESHGVAGWAALETADQLIAALAAGAALMSLLAIFPLWQRHVQPVARWFAIGTFVVIAVKLIDEPGANTHSEPRQGLLIALGAAAVLMLSTMTVAAAPVRRKSTPKRYTPPPAPEYAPESSYGPPQY
jgi:hypothetical protein